MQTAEATLTALSQNEERGGVTDHGVALQCQCIPSILMIDELLNGARAAT